MVKKNILSSFLQNKRNLIIGSVIVIAVLLTFLLKPYLQKREVLGIVEVTLEAWKQNNLSKVVANWDNREVDHIPPIFGLTAYEIKDFYFFKQKGKKFIDVTAQLEFSSIENFPSGRNWVFHLKKGGFGWQILKLTIQ